MVKGRPPKKSKVRDFDPKGRLVSKFFLIRKRDIHIRRVEVKTESP